MLKKLIFFLIINSSIIAMQQPSASINEQLRIAVSLGQLEVAEPLLKYNNADANYKNVLGIAVKDEDLQMIRLLLNYGANPGPLPNILCEVMGIYELVRKNEDLARVKSEVMLQLIRHPNTNLNCTDAKGRTPYAYALEKKATKILEEFKKPEIRARMAKVPHAASVNPPLETATVSTPTNAPDLVYIIYSGNIPELQRLINQGLDINAVALGQIGGKPVRYHLLIWAIIFKQLRVVDWLLNNPSFNPVIFDIKGNTPLMAAINVGSIDVVRRMLRDQRIVKNINAENSQKQTALDLANLKRNTPEGNDIVVLLLQNGAHIGSAETKAPIIAPTGRPNVPVQSYAKLGISPDASAFEILGIAPNATQADIQKAYRQLARQWHPDRYKGEFGKETFALIQWAFETLKK